MVIDGNSLIQSFYALPLLTTKDGIYTNGAYVFIYISYRFSIDYICNDKRINP